VYFHVTFENKTLAGGHIEDKQIIEQMTVLNMDYKTTGLSFKLAKITVRLPTRLLELKLNELSRILAPSLTLACLAHTKHGLVQLSRAGASDGPTDCDEGA